ncbi:hypothetical protein COO09_23930 [Rhizorhabdus dicambivorans]|uniref:Uncharacterized protein n=2 Tax=Rhizorhabdus dicambivorans TaxID=1850238 RepID=A0A2A4FPX0_9SPHN|nr:hypothetical protein COO09_23930 [Rhizorhabdus dicambivorans]
MPATSVIEALRRGETVSQADRFRAAEVSFRAGEIFEPGRYLSDAALAATDLSPREQRQALHGASMAAMVDRALLNTPASPWNWARRSALQLAAGDLPRARASLETSLLLGRVVPRLTVPRLRIMLQLKQRYPQSDLDAVMAEQIRIAARSEPGALARFANRGAAEGITQRVLANDFVLYQAYMKDLLYVRSIEKSEQKPGAR